MTLYRIANLESVWIEADVFEKDVALVAEGQDATVAFEAFPGARFNVEIKRDDPALVDGVIRAVAEAGREKLTLLTAGDDRAMARLRRRLAETGCAPAVGASATRTPSGSRVEAANARTVK